MRRLPLCLAFPVVVVAALGHPASANPENLQRSMPNDSAKQTTLDSQEGAPLHMEDFQRPDIIGALYKGDFSGLRHHDRAAQYQNALYVLQFHRYFERQQDYNFIQGFHSQNPAACGRLFDPTIERFLVRSMLGPGNPLGTPEEQLENLARALMDLLNKGPQALTEVVMNIETAKKMGEKDAFQLVADYGCDSEVTKRVYRNIKPFLLGESAEPLPR
jgi:hypothetical protein